MSKIARLSLSVATAAVKTAGTLAGHAFEKVRDRLPGSDDDDRSDRFSASEARTAPAPTPPPPSPAQEAAPATGRAGTSVNGGNGSPARARTGTATAVPQAPAPTSPPPPSPAEPDHVSREAVQVASVGPADDPGATIQIQAPWNDYDKQPATEIVGRVRAADPTTAAAVALYEGANKGRRTILDAAAKAG